jgi:hypothetical protein
MTTASGCGSLMDFMDKVIDGKTKINFSFDIDDTFEKDLLIAIA